MRTGAESICIKKKDGGDLMLTYAGLCEILRSIAAEDKVSKAVTKPAREK